jgi:hypothetical protein
MADKNYAKALEPGPECLFCEDVYMSIIRDPKTNKFYRKCPKCRTVEIPTTYKEILEEEKQDERERRLRPPQGIDVRLN